MFGQYVNDLPSPFYASAISQGRIERFLVDAITEISGGRLEIERGVTAESFAYEATLDKDLTAYPIQLTLRTLSDSEADPVPAAGCFGGRDVIANGNLPPDEISQEPDPKKCPGHVEVVRAKYLIGCDGAHSWLRYQLNYKTQGVLTNSVW